MTTGKALMQAVIDAPDDDAPRFAFADWIEKNGDSDRAAFIRVQCALEKMATDAPERSSFHARERELLAEHGRVWANEFRGEISEWVYRRGFIERVQMHLQMSAEQIRSVLRKAPIRHVRDTSQFCDFRGVVEALPYLERLTGLEFWCLYSFDSSHVAQMLSSPHLRNLRTLIMCHDRNGNLVDEKVLIEGLASPFRFNLEELAVNVNGGWQGPSTRILNAMAASPHLRKLRKLNLSAAGYDRDSARMDVATARNIGQSPNFANLEELDLGATSFPIEVWDEVLIWPWLPRLKWLRLHYARQVKEPDFFYTVAELEHLPQYRAAFDARVAVIDWESEFIDPWSGGTWKGLTWNEHDS